MSVNETRHDYPFERTIAIEPPQLYAKLQEQERVARVTMPSGDPAFLVTRYEDVRFVLADPRFSVDSRKPGSPRLTDMIIESVMTTDPPEHTRLRGMVSRQFTARRIQRMRPRIQAITDQLLDEMLEKGAPADLHASFAVPLPVTVIGELLGVPIDDLDQFRAWADATVSLSGSVEEHTKAHDSLLAFLADLAQSKREKPGEDLLSALVAECAKERVTEHELLSLVLIMLLAGYEPTSNQLGGSVVALLRHPEEFQRLVDDPALIENAVDELLRYTQPGDGALFRIATEDVMIGDTLIPAGCAILTSTQTANLDERRFPDARRLDVGRKDTAHLGLGHGIHYCLGGALAKVELQIAIGTLVRRFPTLRLAIRPEELRWSMPGSMLSGYTEIPVVW